MKALADSEHYTSAVLMMDGSVQTWGDNQWGQLGDGTKTGRSTPMPVPGLSGVVSMVVGTAHVLTVKQDGFVWSWGGGGYGELGTVYVQSSTPVQSPGTVSFQ